MDGVLSVESIEMCAAASHMTNPNRMRPSKKSAASDRASRTATRSRRRRAGAAVGPLTHEPRVCSCDEAASCQLFLLAPRRRRSIDYIVDRPRPPLFSPVLPPSIPHTPDTPQAGTQSWNRSRRRHRAPAPPSCLSPILLSWWKKRGGWRRSSFGERRGGGRGGRRQSRTHGHRRAVLAPPTPSLPGFVTRCPPAWRPTLLVAGASMARPRPAGLLVDGRPPPRRELQLPKPPPPPLSHSRLPHTTDRLTLAPHSPTPPDTEAAACPSSGGPTVSEPTSGSKASKQASE